MAFKIVSFMALLVAVSAGLHNTAPLAYSTELAHGGFVNTVAAAPPAYHQPTLLKTIATPVHYTQPALVKTIATGPSIGAPLAYTAHPAVVQTPYGHEFYGHGYATQLAHY